VKLRHAIPAGVADAAFASLATLGTGLYAARSLVPADFGAYALFFTGFALATAVPTQLILAPAEFAVIAASPVEGERLSLVRQSWRLGAPWAAASGVAVVVAAAAGSEAPLPVLRALAITTIACSLVSPLQDHVRRLLHLGGASWCAAIVSVVQFGVVVSALFILRATGIDPIWRPLSALTIANTVSLCVGVTFARRRQRQPAVPRYPIRKLLRSGEWLLLGELAVTGASFLSATIVSRLASPAALGHAEAARIVAGPLFMLTLGLNVVLGPRSVQAAAARSFSDAVRIMRCFIGLLVAGGVVYGVATAVPWRLNVLADLIPHAYALAGLVPVTVLGYVLLGSPFPYRAELIGAARERSLPKPALVAGMAQCVATGAAVWVGAFARPLGVAIFGIVASLGYRRERRALYPPDAERLMVGLRDAQPSTSPSRRLG
jgi:O-antigen/teichoic acid export membrane protein